MKSPLNARARQLALLFVLVAASCDKRQEGGDFLPSRILEGEQANVSWDLSSQQRFRLVPMATAGGTAHGAEGHEAHEEPALRLAYELPRGWSELPTNTMRVANFRVAGNEKAECYLSLLLGDGGGLAANINRWRTQLSLEPLSDPEIEALPKATLFGGAAVLLDAAGTWKGMDGSESEAGWRLLGLLVVSAEASAFLKMTGPDATIGSEKENFLALARSIRFEPSPEDSPPPMSPDAQLPMGDHGGLTWTVPAGWKAGPQKPMRAVNLIPQEDVECYLAVLDGDGGGALANINRWRQQLGREGLSQGEFDSLPRLRVMGADSPLVEIEGSGESAGKAMLGLVAIARGRAVFVKMTGPTEAVAKERENFRAFAESIKEGP